MSISIGPQSARPDHEIPALLPRGRHLIPPQDLRRYVIAATCLVGAGLLLALVDEWWTVSHLAAVNAVLMLGAVGTCFIVIFKAKTATGTLVHTAPPKQLDRVTGLPEEQYFWLRLREEYQRSRRFGFPISLVLVDVNNLASINDSYGRESGDAVLHHLADIVESTKRASDIVARLSDDEIALILLDCDKTGSDAFVQRLEHVITRQPPAVSVNGKSMTLWTGVCMGTASALEGESSPEELAAKARRQLDTAREERERRRNRWRSAPTAA